MDQYWLGETTMADTYQLCPCGSGEKIKHCSARPVQNEIAKLVDSLESGQSAAALQRLQQLLKKYPDDTCLLSLQFQLDYPSHLSNEEAVTVLSAQAQNLEKHAPQHIMTLTARLMVSILEGVDAATITSGIEKLYARIHEVEAFPALTYTILRQAALRPMDEWSNLTTAIRLMTWDYAGRTFLSEHDQRHLASFFQTLPALLREDWLARFLVDSESGDIELFGGLVERSICGLWQGVMDDLEKLLHEGQNRAEFYGLKAWLYTARGQGSDAANWWTRYASHPDVAPFAAAMATYNASIVGIETTTYYKISRDVSDFAAANEMLVAAPRLATSLNIAPSVAEVYSPPPRLSFQVLDRDPPLPSDEEALPAAEFPRVLASGLFFGKETDCDARIVVMTTHDFREEATGIIEEAIGEGFSGDSDDVESTRPAEVIADLPTIWMPERFSPAKRQTVQDEFVSWCMKEGLLEMPSRLLEGKTPREAGRADMDANRREAYFYAVYIAMGMPYDDTDLINSLRETLGLSSFPVTNAKQLDIQLQWNAIPFADWTTVPLEDVLEAAFVSLQVGFGQGLSAVTDEMLRRLLVNGEEVQAYDDDQKQAIEHLFRQRLDIIGAGQKALDWVDRVLEVRESLAASEGQWLINRWVLMMAVEDDSGVMETWNRLQPFLNDQEIAGRVQSILVQMGVMNPDGTMNRPPDAAAGQVAGGEQAAPISASAPSSGVWTPESAASEPQQSGKIWLPGQE
ncbi:MAG: SEC-C domain-containing protein [Pirellulaceae bacterium]